MAHVEAHLGSLLARGATVECSKQYLLHTIAPRGFLSRCFERSAGEIAIECCRNVRALARIGLLVSQANRRLAAAADSDGEALIATAVMQASRGPGRPPKDEYAGRHDKRLSKAERAAWQDMYERAEWQREEAELRRLAGRVAMRLLAAVGLPSTMTNAALTKRRATQHMRDKTIRGRGVRALNRA